MIILKIAIVMAILAAVVVVVVMAHAPDFPDDDGERM